MRSYELLMVVRPDVEEEKATAIVEKATNLITAQGGAVDNIDKWGKRRLAYEINDHQDGIYTIVNFKGEPKVEQELDRVLRITDEVIRFLIVRPHE